MVTLHIQYPGELRCEAQHGPSATRLVTDAPVDNQGKGASFSPTDLLATSLGTCMLTTMGIVAQKRGWNLAGSSATVIKHMVADPLRRVGRLEVELRLPPGFDDAQRALLEKTALTCPVQQSLHPQVDIPVVFRWGQG